MDHTLRLLSTLALLVAALGCTASTVTVRKVTGISLDGNRVMIVGSAERYYGSTLLASTPFIQMCTFIEPTPPAQAGNAPRELDANPRIRVTPPMDAPGPLAGQLECVDIDAGLVSIAPPSSASAPGRLERSSDDDHGDGF